MVGAVVPAASSLNSAGAHGVLFDHMIGVGLIIAGIEIHGHDLTKTTLVDLGGGMVGTHPGERK